MSDNDAQILELFRQLTPEQKQALTCLAQAALSLQQQENPCAQASNHAQDA